MKGFITIKINRSFQKLKAPLFSAKAFIVTFMSMSMICMLFFMNCSSTDRPLLLSLDIPSKTAQFTDSNPPGPPIIGDGNNGDGSSDGSGGSGSGSGSSGSGGGSGGGGPVSNITWLHTDVSSWNVTSQITKVEVEQSGQVCIEHSKSGEWEAKSIADPNANTDPSPSDSVEGQAWIIVPIQGAYYAGIYDYMIAGQACHTLDAGSIANLYNSDKSFGKRVDKEPLKSWEAQGGDTIYFMVSTLTTDNISNGQERSNLIKITLPSEDGEDPIVVHKSCEDEPTGPHCPGQCNIPNRAGTIRQTARDDPGSLQQGHQLNLNRASNGAPSADDSRWKFMDTIVEKLNETDPRWGYTCVGGDCEDISTDTLGFLCNNTDKGTAPIDIIDNTDGSVQWTIKSAGDDTWKFPRKESPDEDTKDEDTEDEGIEADNDVSDFSWDKVRWIADEINVSCWPETSQITSVKITQRGAICVDHTKKNAWPDGNEAAWSTNQPLIASLWAIVKLKGQYYAGTWELAVRGETCKLGHYEPNGKLSDIYKSVWAEHFKSGPLKSWRPRGGDVVGFMASGLARHLHHHSIQERTSIVWYRLPSLDGSIQGGEVGRFSKVAAAGKWM